MCIIVIQKSHVNITIELHINTTPFMVWEHLWGWKQNLSGLIRLHQNQYKKYTMFVHIKSACLSEVLCRDVLCSSTVVVRVIRECLTQCTKWACVTVEVISLLCCHSLILHLQTTRHPTTRQGCVIIAETHWICYQQYQRVINIFQIWNLTAINHKLFNIRIQKHTVISI